MILRTSRRRHFPGPWCIPDSENRRRHPLPAGAVVVVFFLLCGAVEISTAQSGADLRQGLVDYPLPDPAALQAVQDRSPMLLQPSTVRSAVFSADARVTDAGTLTAVGVEFAPILIGNGIDLSEYLSGRLFRVLLRTRVSIASTIGAGSGMRGSLGLRWMLHDDADLRSDSSFQRALVALGENNRAIESACATSAPTGSPAHIACLTETVSRQRGLQPLIDSLRAAMAERMWNKSVFELAVAAVYRPLDGTSPGRGIAVRNYRLYLNCAFPMLGQSGQIVFGAGVSAGREDALEGYRRRASFLVRSWYGSLTERIFLEAGIHAVNALEADTRLAIGGTIRIANGAWLQITGGADIRGRAALGPEASLKLGFGTPELRL